MKRLNWLSRDIFVVIDAMLLHIYVFVITITKKWSRSNREESRELRDKIKHLRGNWGPQSRLQSLLCLCARAVQRRRRVFAWRFVCRAISVKPRMRQIVPHDVSDTWLQVQRCCHPLSHQASWGSRGEFARALPTQATVPIVMGHRRWAASLLSWGEPDGLNCHGTKRPDA